MRRQQPAWMAGWAASRSMSLVTMPCSSLRRPARDTQRRRGRQAARSGVVMGSSCGRIAGSGAPILLYLAGQQVAWQRCAASRGRAMRMWHDFDLDASSRAQRSSTTTARACATSASGTGGSRRSATLAHGAAARDRSTRAGLHVLPGVIDTPGAFPRAGAGAQGGSGDRQPRRRAWAASRPCSRCPTRSR